MCNTMMESLENLSSKVEFWNVDLPKTLLEVDEELENLDVLCELVRNQYLKRLHQTLISNLDETKCYQNMSMYQIQQCVDLCMAEMEKHALRRCMIASIYREGMSRMINEVKTSTNKSVLYVLLKQIIESNNQLPLSDKYFGAENIKKHSVSIGINTEAKLNKTISTQDERCMDLDNNYIINNDKISTILVTDVLNKSNFPSSYNVKSEISESNVYNNLNSLLKSSSCSSSPNKCDSTEFSSLQGYNKSEQHNSTKNGVSSLNTLLRDLEDSPEYEQQPSKLEERLISLGLGRENQNSSDNISDLCTSVHIKPNTIRSKKVNDILKNKYQSARVAKSYELRKSMNELPQELKTRLNQRFYDLFGNDHTYESDPLSMEEERVVAHKRIVKLVVEFMTPYYKAQRIKRHLFKTLAKLISKNLMNRSYDPDEETVAGAVKEFFIGNRSINTAEDIYK